MNFKLLLASVAIPLLFALPRDGLSNNGIEVYQFEYTDTESHPYVECLGEGIDHEMTVTIRTHMVERPNGSVQFVEHYFFEGYSFGKDSGLTWYTKHSPGPWVWNDFGDGQLVDGWTLEILWKPLDGGRQVHEKGHYQLVYDANGVPRVEHNPNWDYDFLCVGKK